MKKAMAFCLLGMVVAALPAHAEAPVLENDAMRILFADAARGYGVTGIVNKENYTAMMDTNAIGVNTNTSTTDYVELRQGNRGNAVVRLQARLQALGYYSISVDGIYGSGTRSAVRRFQSRNGLSASGIATIQTQQVLFGSSAIANNTSAGTSVGYVYLHYGSNGEAVKRLQTALKNAGYYKGAIDGQYYDQTYAAVKAFQRACGLDVDGIAGRKTQNALYGTNY
jgi:N-acetylmuramoyl-L-alanine amidase